MGLCYSHSFNLALLGKHGWNLLSNPNCLATRLLKDRFYLLFIFLGAQLGHNPSFIWRSIWMARSVIALGSRWRICNGEIIYQCMECDRYKTCVNYECLKVKVHRSCEQVIK